jgi:ABC-type multidrug transport system fused ATPase/permease subunit
MGLPDQYDSRIDERGVNLSEGYKKGSSIARALIKKPNIFILDEPTSALDSITEGVIFSPLLPFVQDKTMFIVKCQIPRVQAADSILLFDKNTSSKGDPPTRN